MRKLFYGLMLAGMLIMVIASPVLAAVYYASVQVQESDGSSYTRLPIMVSLDNEYLADNNYILATGLDTRVITGSSVELPHLVVDDRLLFVSNINANNTYNFKYTTGNTPLTDMPIIVGYDGYITIPSEISDDMQLGDDFEIEFDGYVDTSVGSNKNLVYKWEAFRLYISDTSEITAAITDGDSPTLYSSDSDGHITATSTVYNTAWAAASGTIAAGNDTFDIGQNFATPNYNIWRGFVFFDTSSIPDNATIISATLSLYGVTDNSVTDFLITVQNGQATYPTDPLAVTDYNKSYYSGDGGSLTTEGFNTVGYNNITLNSTGIGWINLTGTTKLCLRSSRDIAGTTPTGNEYVIVNDAHNTGTTKDPKLVVVYEYDTKSATVTSISSGIIKPIITAGANLMTLSVYDTEDNHLGDSPQSVDITGVSVPDNANDIIINQNNVMPYFDYLKWTVSDTLIAWYQPLSMIVGTTLDDREGTDAGETGTAEEDATITWGANPAGVDVDIGSLTAYSQPAPSGTITEPGQDIVDETGQPGWTDETGTLTTNPFYPAVLMASEQTGFDVTQIWLMIATFFVIGGMLAVFGFVPHQLITVCVGGGITGFFVSMGIYPFWVIFIFLVMGVAVVLWERAPSV